MIFSGWKRFGTHEQREFTGAEMFLGLGRCPDEMEETKLHVSSRERSQAIFLQVLPSYLLAGLGMVTAGMLLDHVQVSESPPEVKVGVRCKVICTGNYTQG